MAEQLVTGHEVIERLAERFVQLYVAPSDDELTQELNRRARLSGFRLPDASLDHFVTSDEDELRLLETPAGPIEVAHLAVRKDFETFLQIVGHKSQPVAIAPSVGAITYRGLADWGQVAQAREAYLAAGGDDWPAEFSRLAKEPGAFRAELIILSKGPYSNVPASETPFDEEEWLQVSHEIRLHHECAHVVCRRIMPDDILPVWDEVTADVTGLLFACKGYKASLAARFLGVTPDGFTGGRLSEYLSEEQLANIDAIASELFASLVRIEELVDEEAVADPFSFLLALKHAPLIAY